MERRADHQNQTPRVLVEFLEVAITSIVFLRGIYPPGAFERRRYMNIVVQRARHPQLREYIHSAVTGLQPFIQKGLVERVTVIFYDKDCIPAERFVFKLILNELYGSNVEQRDLELALRSFLIKLSVAEPVSKPLPRGDKYTDDHGAEFWMNYPAVIFCFIWIKTWFCVIRVFPKTTPSSQETSPYWNGKDCSWEITAYFRTLPAGSKEAQLWIPTDTKQWQQPPLITPIKSMSSEPLRLQLYIEHPSHSEPTIPANAS